MIVVDTGLVERYFADRAGHKRIKAARSQYDAWLTIAGQAQWTTLEDVKRSHPKPSILKGGRVLFNIKGNDFRLVGPRLEPHEGQDQKDHQHDRGYDSVTLGHGEWSNCRGRDRRRSHRKR
jgi:mRNA interferase HigB